MSQIQIHQVFFIFIYADKKKILRFGSLRISVLNTRLNHLWISKHSISLLFFLLLLLRATTKRLKRNIVITAVTKKRPTEVEGIRKRNTDTIDKWAISFVVTGMPGVVDVG